MNVHVTSRVPRFGVKGPQLSAPAGVRHRNKPGCRTSQYCPPGSVIPGLSHSNQPSKVVHELDYGLNDEQYKQLSKRFPGIAFVQVGTDCHDHPIAHTSYKVVWSNVLKKIPAGSLVADVAGNPSVNESFNKAQMTRANPSRIDTFCQVLSTKDSIRRKVRWGPMLAGGLNRWEEMTLYDMYRNETNRDRFSQYDYFLMNHVLYYYTFAEITKLLTINPDSVLYATVHKLDGQSGAINCGEQTFNKDFVTGKVLQTNVETGETYSHNDPAPWFKKFAYADASGAIAWTVNKGCDDTYVLTITSTDPKLVPEDCWLDGNVYCRDMDTNQLHVIPGPELVEPPPAYAVEEVVLKTSDFLPGYHEEKEVRIRISHPELYKKLKHFMTFKPRNEQTLKDLTSKAHREAGNNTLVGSNGKLDVDPDDLKRMVACAWRHGAALEDDMIRFVSQDSGGSIRSLNNSLSGKPMFVNSTNVVKQVAKFALLLEGVRNAKAPHIQALQVIEDLF